MRKYRERMKQKRVEILVGIKNEKPKHDKDKANERH